MLGVCIMLILIKRVMVMVKRMIYLVNRKCLRLKLVENTNLDSYVIAEYLPNKKVNFERPVHGDEVKFFCQIFFPHTYLI